MANYKIDYNILGLKDDNKVIVFCSYYKAKDYLINILDKSVFKDYIEIVNLSNLLFNINHDKKFNNDVYVSYLTNLLDNLITLERSYSLVYDNIERIDI